MSGDLGSWLPILAIVAVALLGISQRWGRVREALSPSRKTKSQSRRTSTRSRKKPQVRGVLVKIGRQEHWVTGRNIVHVEFER